MHTHTCARTHTHTRTRSLELKVHFDVCRLPHLSMIYNISITPDNFLAPRQSLPLTPAHTRTALLTCSWTHSHTAFILLCLASVAQPDILIVCCLVLLQTGHPLFTCSRLSCQSRAKSSMGRESSLLSAFAVIKIGYSWSFRRSDRDEKRAKTMGRK